MLRQQKPEIFEDSILVKDLIDSDWKKYTIVPSKQESESLPHIHFYVLGKKYFESHEIEFEIDHDSSNLNFFGFGKKRPDLIFDEPRLMTLYTECPEMLESENEQNISHSIE